MGSNNLWHVVSSQLIKLLLLIGCDEVLLKHVPWGLKWLLHLTIMGIGAYKDCGMGWILMSALECLQNGHDKYSSLHFPFNSCSGNHKASMATLNGSPGFCVFFCSYKTNISNDQTQNIKHMGCRITICIEFTALPNLSQESWGLG